jgi:Helix-turn-helix domain of resolvase
VPFDDKGPPPPPNGEMPASEPPKRNPWRPSKYRPEMCEQVVELGAQGKSRTSIATILGIERQTLPEWEHNHPEFLVAMKRARQLSQLWWEEVGQKNIAAAPFQGAVYNKQMACRFPEDHRETLRTELIGSDGQPVTPQVNVTISTDKPQSTS